MEKIFVISILITTVYFLVRFLEMKFITKQMKPLKELMRDTLIVLMCSAISCFFYFSFSENITGLINVVTDNKVVTPATTQIFTDEPGF